MQQGKEGGEPTVPVWAGEELLDMFSSGNSSPLGSYFENPGAADNATDGYAGSDNQYYESDLPA